MKTSHNNKRPFFFTWINRHYPEICKEYGDATACKYASIGAELSAKGKTEVALNVLECVRLARRGLGVIPGNAENPLAILFDPRLYSYNAKTRDIIPTR